MEVPLILTLALEANAHLFFNSLRKIYFPAERNFIEAHLTLFHLLPKEPSIEERVEQLAATQPPFSLDVTGPVATGNGVAFAVESPTLKALHKSLQTEWRSFLIPQDLQGLWPHITVQNKVDAASAQELLAFLKENFSAFAIQATGLQLWEYHGGPWKLYRQFDFTGN